MMSEEQASCSKEVDDVEAEPDVHFTPVVELPVVRVKTFEDNEVEIFKMRAKLFRYDSVEDPAIWKERGVGDIRMLKRKDASQVRLLMRRDHVHKICCNHYLMPQMKLKRHGQSDRAFIWTTLADFSDEEKKEEVLAIRFRDAESAEKFRSKFDSVVEDLSQDNKENDEKTSDKEITLLNKSGDDKEIEETAETLATLSVSNKDDKKDED